MIVSLNLKIFKLKMEVRNLRITNLEIFRPNLDGYDAKTDALYLKGLLADKLLVYDDSKLKIGCIRSVSMEWRQATLKLYLGNKS